MSRLVRECLVMETNELDYDIVRASSIGIQYSIGIQVRKAAKKVPFLVVWPLSSPPPLELSAHPLFWIFFLAIPSVFRHLVNKHLWTRHSIIKYSRTTIELTTILNLPVHMSVQESKYTFLTLFIHFINGAWKRQKKNADYAV